MLMKSAAHGTLPEVRFLILRGDKRKALCQAPGTAVTFPGIPIHGNAQLLLGYGADDRMWNDETLHITFQVEAENGSGEKSLLFCDHIGPGEKCNQGRWLDAAIVLSDFTLRGGNTTAHRDAGIGKAELAEKMNVTGEWVLTEKTDLTGEVDPEGEVDLTRNADFTEKVDFTGEVDLTFSIYIDGNTSVLPVESMTGWSTLRIISEGRDVLVAPQEHANLILITIDTLRADHLGCYGYPPARTPVIDRFAEKNITFTRAFCHAPITTPSHASLFTSQYPFQTGLLNNTERLDTDAVTLAEAFQSRGYHTAGFVSLEVLNAFTGMAKGFDSYSGVTAPPYWKNAEEVNDEVFEWLDFHYEDPFFLWVHYSDPHEPYHSPNTPFAPILVMHESTAGVESIGTASCDLLKRIHFTLDPGVNFLHFYPHTTGGHLQNTGFNSAHLERDTFSKTRLEGISSSKTQGEVIPLQRKIQFRHVELFSTRPVTWEWARGWSGEHEAFYRSWRTLTSSKGTITVHNPAGTELSTTLQFLPVENLDLDTLVARYDGEISYADSCLGNLLTRIDELNLSSSTAIIITSDHGEGLGEHGLIGHIEQLYGNLLHVPLLVRVPEVQKARIVETCVRHVDLFPTIMELYHLPGSTHIEGVSLMPLIGGRITGWPSTNNTSFSTAHTLAETHPPEARRTLYSIHDGEWKLIIEPDTGQKELYHTTVDQRELTNVLADNRQKANDLEGILAGKIRGFCSERSANGSRAARIADALEALGYVGGKFDR
jgi:arylsulfatase A-like enzyme